jgi:hypothetical protein
MRKRLPEEFYMASSEGYDMDSPRKCTAVNRLTSEGRDDLLLVHIDPPLIGQKFGLGGRDVNHVIVATRHQGECLFRPKRWPVSVHVARLLAPYEDQDVVRNDELESIAWAELYLTEDDARSNTI